MWEQSYGKSDVPAEKSLSILLVVRKLLLRWNPNASFGLSVALRTRLGLGVEGRGVLVRESPGRSGQERKIARNLMYGMGKKYATSHDDA